MVNADGWLLSPVHPSAGQPQSDGSMALGRFLANWAILSDALVIIENLASPTFEITGERAGLAALNRRHRANSIDFGRGI